MKYLIRKTATAPPLDEGWDGEYWRTAETLEVANFLPEGSDHRPRTRARVLYDDQGIHGLFHVLDRYVRCVHTNFQDQVSRDSCVEFFVLPKQDKGYFNFEFNCGGALLCYYIEDCERTEDGFKKRAQLSEEDGALVRIHHSLPERIEEEIEEETEWTLGFFIPFALLEKYAGQLGKPAGQTWRANFYKCGSGTSHPHYAAWSPVDEVNFHLPRCFGEIVFER